MATVGFFSSEPDADLSYRNIREATNDFTRAAREKCEALWELYEPYADKEFLIEIRNNFDARYWEMYLTTFLIQEGYKVVCPKPGPDVGIMFEGRRIWFEATAPTRGAVGAPDQVPEAKLTRLGETPVFQDTPNERMILRYLNSISEKYNKQYPNWLKSKIVGSDDAFVIAINPRRLGHEFGDTVPPRILQAAFAIGAPYAVINSRTMEQVSAGYQFRDKIIKNSGKPVSTGVLHLEEYSGLSSLLCSRVDAVNQPNEMGADFQLVPNPWARAPLPQSFRLKGTFFQIQHKDDDLVAIPEINR